MNHDAVLLMSGGIDSTVLMHYLRENGINKIYALYVDIGREENSTEYERVQKIVGSFPNTDLHRIEIRGIEDIVRENLVIPNRNALLLSMATLYAIDIDIYYVYIGAHRSDYGIFKDCRSIFFTKLEEAFILGHQRAPRIMAPFIDKDKSEIIQLGGELGVDFTQTWSCYENKKVHCGKCLSCEERKMAFKKAGVVDKTTYGG